MRWTAHLRYTGLAAMAILLAGTLALVPSARSRPAFASSGISQRLGWDACGIGSTANAQAFWSNTPFSNLGLYLGGSSYGGGCTRWNTAQVNTLLGQGWRFLPLWVGPQAPCTGFGSRFSTDAGTAYNQGANEAIAAYQRIKALGWDTTNTPIIYDLEGFNTGNAGCMAAAKNFVSGWVHQMHTAPAQRAGVYGSACASGLSTFASIANVPDFIEGADWSGVRQTRTIGCVPGGYWAFHQRHKQYRGDHLETWNGVTLNIDSDCSDGPVYPGPDAMSTGTGCV